MDAVGKPSLGSLFGLPLVVMDGRPLESHTCKGQYRKDEHGNYICLECGAICQVPADGQVSEGSTN